MARRAGGPGASRDNAGMTQAAAPRHPALSRPARLLAGLLALSLMAYVLLAGAQPGATAWIPEGWDKLVHLAFHATLAVLGLWAMGLPARPWVLGVCVAYGVLDEILQAYTPGRVPSAADLLADVIGAGLVVVLAPGCWQRWLAPRLRARSG